MATEIESTRSAAMLLLALGESEAATVLKHLDAKVVQRLGTAMAQMKSASRDEVAEVLGGFVLTMEGQADIKVGSDDYIRRVLTSALGDDKASSIIDRIQVGRKSKGLDVLKWMEPRAIAELVKHEHPQVLAIVISYLDSDLAARVLSELPADVQTEVLLRVAQLDGVQPTALGKLDEMIEKQIAGKGGNVSANLGGPKTAASILNFMSATIIEELRKADETLTARLQDLMFTFGDMIGVDDKGIQTVLREVDSARLVIAMKGADAALVEHFMKNMSSRAAEMLKDDMETRGPVKLSEVEAAQKEILAITRKLADAGTIALGGAAGEQYV
ncbi:MAG TPA: flagellar motor switch protein FliG [Steroidobacteraceae bacterium]|nr:flagellar motor switch protein FliG [Steroidobacteraceae bacterium]